MIASSTTGVPAGRARAAGRATAAAGGIGHGRRSAASRLGVEAARRPRSAPAARRRASVDGRRRTEQRQQRLERRLRVADEAERGRPRPARAGAASGERCSSSTDGGHGRSRRARIHHERPAADEQHASYAPSAGRWPRRPAASSAGATAGASVGNTTLECSGEPCTGQPSASATATSAATAPDAATSSPATMASRRSPDGQAVGQLVEQRGAGAPRRSTRDGGGDRRVALLVEQVHRDRHEHRARRRRGARRGTPGA